MPAPCRYMPASMHTSPPPDPCPLAHLPTTTPPILTTVVLVPPCSPLQSRARCSPAPVTCPLASLTPHPLFLLCPASHATPSSPSPPLTPRSHVPHAAQHHAAVHRRHVPALPCYLCHLPSNPRLQPSLSPMFPSPSLQPPAPCCPAPRCCPPPLRAWAPSPAPRTQGRPRAPACAT